MCPKGVLALVCSAALLIHAANPQVRDPRLELALFASDPAIVTPIGLAVDARDRLFVIESHTHSPPRDYKGPKSDQIKIFHDADADGIPDRISVFADGFKDAMNLAFSPDGDLYVACAREVWRLSDKNNDSVADECRRILELKTSNMHSHSALLGITFGPDGSLYVSRGNNGSARYSLLGVDSSSISGYGDGGNIVRCLPDGSNLREFATGFWNPFDIKFDSFGRLLCVDNDPDARGPNRLLHVVPQGDYGYKSIYGGAGNHPFQAWEGELPGTLPMIDGTGEAPSGLLDCKRAALPPDYQNDLLVTIWNENTITRHSTSPKGVSLTATNQILISGEQDFRPVALDVDSKGAIYITDWVLVDYPNHGRGRIWKLSARQGEKVSTPLARFSAPRLDARFKPFEDLLRATNLSAFPRLQESLSSADPFVRHAAVTSLSAPAFREQLLAAARDPSASIRLGALLSLRKGNFENPAPLLRSWLRDSSPDVRMMALVWSGESGLIELKPALDDALKGPGVSGALFAAYLAAVECLDPEYIQAFRSARVDKANQLKRTLPPNLLPAIIQETNWPANVRALALTRLEPPNARSLLPQILHLAANAEPLLRKEALRTLALLDHPSALGMFLSVANNQGQPRDARGEALLALSAQRDLNPHALLPLLMDNDTAIQAEAARALRLHASDPIVKAAFEKRLASRPPPAVREQLQHALGGPGESRPSTLADWQQALSRGGDPAAGERVFYSPFAACSQCHTIHNRGGKLGPDLSNIAQSIDRSQIVHSILRPSDQFPPQYQAWFIRAKDGETHEGLQLDHANSGLELLTTSGEFQFFPSREIEAYGVLPRSLMPDNLEQALTISDFRNLVAFLDSLK